MPATEIGDGVVSESDVYESSPEPTQSLPSSDSSFEVSDSASLSDVVSAIKNSMREEMAAAVADIERRLAQARQLERSALYGEPRQVHTEDLNIGRHLLDGYLLTANSPSTGSIAWSDLHVVFLGVDYTIADGNTDKRYAWFIKPSSGTTATLQTGDTLPALGANDALIFVNNGGVPVSALETSISYAVGPGVIGDAQLSSAVQQTLSTLQANDIALQSALDGAITTYYQDEPPWPAGSPSPDGGNVNMGDVWYDSNDGGAFRWTGASPGSGTTANTWQRIADTDTSELAGKVNTKTTTYLASTASPPVAPAGGFTIGDLWMKTNMNNLLARWSGSAWVDLQIGDAGISGVSGTKVGSGINAGNITTGTLPGIRVGSGVNPSVLTGSGTAPLTAIPQLNPSKLNTAFHMLY